jgi:hypothetical protein
MKTNAVEFRKGQIIDVFLDNFGQSPIWKLKFKPLFVCEEFEHIENGLDWNPFENWIEPSIGHRRHWTKIGIIKSSKNRGLYRKIFFWPKKILKHRLLIIYLINKYQIMIGSDACNCWELIFDNFTYNSN